MMASMKQTASTDRAAISGEGPPLPPWPACDAFCIHSYSGESGRPCGWRGLLHEARLDEERRLRVCPRCGRPAVMPIPRNGEGI
jgi:hypothetical protein